MGGRDDDDDDHDVCTINHTTIPLSGTTPPTNSHALFSELERELCGRFDVTEEEDAVVRKEVIDGRLGGLVAWAAASRTRDVDVGCRKMGVGGVGVY